MEEKQVSFKTNASTPFTNSRGDVDEQSVVTASQQPEDHDVAK